ncbi:uncharacterized protein C8orf76 isoform X2 [Corythoichthys intestinalis]|uniref:uncharacterized protein C8orf76 isoform X2 n=1 Tax=Corythoichthys intestinalis TaxID=161448 RepID=UPI0025A61B4A|nr:uncharacterized protein C8orf76 isoform X2 [Corythoichthys intestinalis]
MELFGSNFDDSVFLEAKDRSSVSVSSYNAKTCEPEWFGESAALDTEDSLEKQKIFKFRGDLATWKGKYQSKEASNTCHLTSLLLLKVTVYQHFGLVGPLMSSLQELCSLLPFNPWNWHNLGKMCMHRLEHGTTLKAESIEPDAQHEDFSKERLWLKACMCFIRMKLLLTILQQQQSSFVLRRNHIAIQTAEEALAHLHPNQTTLLNLTEVMSEDLNPEKMREDYQDGMSLSSICLQTFQERWWDKILLSGVLEADRCGRLSDSKS